MSNVRKACPACGRGLTVQAVLPAGHSGDAQCPYCRSALMVRYAPQHRPPCAFFSVTIFIVRFSPEALRGLTHDPHFPLPQS